MSNPALIARVRILTMMCWPFSSTLPSGVLLFWVTSNVWAIARSYITRLDWVRSKLGIPLRKTIAKLKHLPPAVNM